MNRHLLIFLDKYVFKLAFYVIVLLSKFRAHKYMPMYLKPDPQSRFLVIRPGGLGDALMAVPFLKALKKSFPNSKVTLMLQKKNQAALQYLDAFDELIIVDALNGLFKNIYKIRRNHFDIVLDLEPFRKVSSIISYLSGAPIRIGFDTNNRRLLYTHYVTYANEKNYDSLNMTRQLKVIGIDVAPQDASDIGFPLPEESSKKAGEILASNGLNWVHDFIVAVAPGVLKPHHRWNMQRFAGLIELILDEDPKTKVVLMGAPADQPDVKEVMEHLQPDNRVVDLVGKTTFVDALAIFRHCKTLIACDGGMVYMAAAMGCGTISLWGPGVMERFKPPGDKHIGVRKNYFCAPCINYSRLGEFPHCAYDRACIQDISIFEVFQEYKKWKNRALPVMDTAPTHVPSEQSKPRSLWYLE